MEVSTVSAVPSSSSSPSVNGALKSPTSFARAASKPCNAPQPEWRLVKGVIGDEGGGGGVLHGYER